jgi:hypothetical protein
VRQAPERRLSERRPDPPPGSLRALPLSGGGAAHRPQGSLRLGLLVLVLVILTAIRLLLLMLK